MMDEQILVNSHFEQDASYWAEVYERDDDINALIYQERLRILLELVKTLDLSRQERVLEVGCGAGQAAIALAKLGYEVDAIDAIQLMVDATRDRAVKCEVESRVRTNLGDVGALSFPNERFGLVVALGVLPWLPSSERPMKEMCRVLSPRGYLIMSVGNSWGLPQFLDPFANPFLRPTRQLAKRVVRRVLGRSEIPKPRWRPTTIRGCDTLLSANRLEKLDGLTFGFGPFTMFGYRLLPHSLGVKVHRRLQALADRRIPVLRSAGTFYTVLGRKTGSAPC
jgi:SAM-dependent methyltransferase